MNRDDELERMLQQMQREGFELEDLDRMMAAAQRSGRAAKVTFIDDPDSPEGKAAADYVDSHRWLPLDHASLPVERIVAEGERLLSPDTSPGNQKRALMLLAHHPSQEALDALKRYRRTKLTPEMKTWARMAQSECEEAIQQQRYGTPVHGMTLSLSKVGRNEPCPCGSGKKFKKCCGR